MKLVLLHPLPLDGSIWSSATRALADECVAPTLYDHGNDLEAWARGALDLAGGGPLTVVGCSVGGSCAIEMAHLAPDDVHGRSPTPSRTARTGRSTRPATTCRWRTSRRSRT
ncbi:MAG: alpha/beta hydrolase [Actinomycetota bacterium]|nr:alpha/beta hydrolase [Actinomycetota bacterium]